MPQIKLPDGSLRQFEDAITVRQIAEAIGAGLANAALAGKVNNELVDTSFLSSSTVRWQSLLKKMTRRLN